MFKRIRIGIAGAAVALLAGCAAPHDTFGFKGVVYSNGVSPTSTQTTAVPTKGGMLVMTNTAGGFMTYVLVLDDQSKYAVRSFNKFAVGDCVAVYMSAERAKTQGGYLMEKDTTVTPSSGCKGKVDS